MESFIASLFRIKADNAQFSAVTIRRLKAIRMPEPQQKRSVNTKNMILASARSAFAQHGFEGSNIRDIALDVGVTHTLIRYHFGNKEELWKAVVDDMHDRLLIALGEGEASIVDLTKKEGIRTWVRFYIRYCAENPEQARIMINESMSQSHRLEYLVDRIRQSHKGLIPLFSQSMENGDLPDVWLVSLFYIISSVCQMPFVLSTAIKNLYDVEITSEQAIEAHTDAVLAILLKDEPTSKSAWPPLPPWTEK